MNRDDILHIDHRFTHDADCHHMLSIPTNTSGGTGRIDYSQTNKVQNRIKFEFRVLGDGWTLNVQ